MPIHSLQDRVQSFRDSGQEAMFNHVFEKLPFLRLTGNTYWRGLTKYSSS
jgi:hypothetical protein